MSTMLFHHPVSGITYRLDKAKCDNAAEELDGSASQLDFEQLAEELGLPDELDVYIMLEQEFGIYQCAVCGWYGDDAEPDGDEPVCSDCKGDE